MNSIQVLQDAFGDRLKADKNISPHLTLRTRTTAQWYLEAESPEDWQRAPKLTSEHHIPLFILGGGSNMAVTSDRIPGLTVRNMYRKFAVLADGPDYADVFVSSGYIVNQLVRETTSRGLSGVEYHLGLPGTVGGALYMNSKWTRSNPASYFGDSLLSANILDRNGTVRREERAYFRFAYDYSILHKTHEFLLDAVFRFTKESPELLKQRSFEAMEYRKKTQPFGVSTCGCFFQNITEEEQKTHGLPTRSAGYLIDQSGLKEASMGGFTVSPVHANFIVNTGEGKPEDLVALLSKIKAAVQSKFGIELKEEVLII